MEWKWTAEERRRASGPFAAIYAGGREAWRLTDPGSGAVDKPARSNCFCWGMDLDDTGVGADEADGCVGRRSMFVARTAARIRPGQVRGGRGCARRSKRKRWLPGSSPGTRRGRVFGSENGLVCSDLVSRRESLKGGAGLKGNREAGEIEQAVEKGWIEREAEFGERKELRRVFGIVRGKHSCSSGRGFGRGSPRSRTVTRAAAAVKLEREREADDAGSGDADRRVEP